MSAPACLLPFALSSQSIAQSNTYIQPRKWTLRERAYYRLAEVFAVDSEWGAYIADLDQGDGSEPLPQHRGHWPCDPCADPRESPSGCPLRESTRARSQGEALGYNVAEAKARRRRTLARRARRRARVR